MKKSSLLKMKDLYATEEMLAVAHEDVPVKIDYGWTVHYRSEYSGFARSAVEGDVLKVALYDHKALRLGGKLPVYEVFINRERQQFLTYDHVCAIWRTAKINNLKWEPTGASKIWISDEDAVQILQYLPSDQENAYRAILDFQLTVRDRELERRHRKRKPIPGMWSWRRRHRCRRTGVAGSRKWVSARTTSSMTIARAAQSEATALTVKRKSR